MASGSGGGNLSGSFASGVMLQRADSGAAFNAVFHGIDPDISSSPPPDDSANNSEKLGHIQFKLSYDFQVRIYSSFKLHFTIYLLILISTVSVISIIINR